MFKLSRLRYKRSRALAALDRKKKILEDKNASLSEIQRLIEVGFVEINELDEEIAHIVGLRLSREAISLDLEVPDDEETWEKGEKHAGFTAKGRAQVRKVIDAEKARRFEVKTLWITKFWLPLFAALIGIIGALTGLVAVLQHKK
jgi:hypothetical protein